MVDETKPPQDQLDKILEDRAKAGQQTDGKGGEKKQEKPPEFDTKGLRGFVKTALTYVSNRSFIAIQNLGVFSRAELLEIKRRLAPTDDEVNSVAQGAMLCMVKYSAAFVKYLPEITLGIGLMSFRAHQQEVCQEIAEMARARQDAKKPAEAKQ